MCHSLCHTWAGWKYENELSTKLKVNLDTGVEGYSRLLGLKWICDMILVISQGLVMMSGYSQHLICTQFTQCFPKRSS